MNDKIEAVYPLSSMQHGMLLHSIHDHERGVYLHQTLCELHEPLRLPEFIKAWQLIFDRHAVLRTCFRWENFEEPVQEVHTGLELPFSVQDWSGLTTEVQEESLLLLLKADRRRGFDVEQAPLMRVNVLRMADADYRLLWTFHSALLDGRSHFLLLEELFHSYDSYCNGREPELNQLRPYSDYIKWLSDQEESKSAAFWRSELRGFRVPTTLRLPLPEAKDSAQQEHHGSEETHLSNDFTSELEHFATDNKVTLNNLVQASWAWLLSIYTGEQDVLFGVTRACRHWSVDNPDTMVGLYINTLPFRVVLDPRQRLVSWLQELRAQQIRLRDYEETPLPRIQEWSETPRGMALFESVLMFEAYQMNSKLRGLGKSWSRRTCELHERMHNPLTFAAYGAPDLLLKLQYDQQHFDRRSIAQMLNHLSALLACMVANPDRRLMDLSLLTDQERQQLLIDWNHNSRPYPTDKCIHQLFEEQVARTPEALGVVSGGQTLRYRELNQRANQLARYLRKLGVGPEVHVAICLERSVEMIIGKLGILKAGGVYLPLEPSHPPDRLKFVLEDADVKVLLTQQRLLKNIPDGEEVRVLLDRDWAEISCESDDDLKNEVEAENLAYAIYTSGSTGRPKGVQITHHSLLNLVQWHNHFYEVTGSDRATQLVSVAFDVCVWELWPYLVAGASIHLPSEEIRSDPVLLRDWLVANQITITYLPTPLAERLLQLPWPSKGSKLRALLTGGDRLHHFHDRSLPFAIINNYGITEAAVISTAAKLSSQDQNPSMVDPPIGTPISNVQAYVLDHLMAPVPVGVGGELYVGGDGVARSYLNNPAATAERFVPDMIGGVAGARLYKTGDAVRFRPDGNIDFLGRNDCQVKVRGYRIELGEIESILGQHPSLIQAAVVVREDNPGETWLLAYVIAAEGARINARELQLFLKEKLPDYMIPSMFVEMKDLPLTSNGKLDRRALSASQVLLPETHGRFVLPRTPTQELLATIWEEVLKLNKVGIRDNFFEMGGHSLLATRLLARIRHTLHVDLTFRELFEQPTVEKLALRIEEARGQGEGQGVPAMERAERGGKLPLSYAQQRLWFIDQFEPNSALYNIPLGLRLEGELRLDALQQSLSEIVRRHEALRTSFVEVDGEAVQVIGEAERLALPLIDLSELGAEERQVEARRVGSAEAGVPFELSRGPLVRARIVRMREQEHELLLTMHHIIADGWSMGVLGSELKTIYGAISAGEESPLEEMGLQYADYAVWQREWLQGAVLEEQLSYWRKELGGEGGVLELPSDRARPAVQSHRGAEQSIEVSEAVTRGLKKLSRVEGVTLFMTLLAGFKTLLYRYTGAAEIRVGTPIANRNRVESEGMIGFFVNTLVLRSELAGEMRFAELMKRVRETAIEGYGHQDVPFEKLVEELEVERELSHTPLFQVMFVLQNAPLGEVELAGLKLQPSRIAGRTAKFDLTLNLMEHEGQLVGVIEYNTDLFGAVRMERMSRHLVTLLAGVVAHPEQRLSELPVLSEAETRQLQEWNQTGVEYPGKQSIGEMFEEQVERQREAVAVVHGAEQVSYGELNRRANQLGHYLREMGVGAEERVGICMERSVAMVVGLLGILKAGGAYVPLEASYPAERLAYMVADAGVTVVLTQESQAGVMRSEQVRVVRLEAEWERVSGQSEANLVSEVRGENLGYVIYTSGSTGRPKGVGMSQGSLINLVKWQRERSGKAGEGRTLQYASMSFDVSFQEIFSSLVSGGVLVMVDEEERRDPEALLRLVSEQKVRRMFLPVVGLQQLSEASGGGEVDLRELEEVITAGEQLQITPSIVRFFREWGGSRLENQYGPTESHVVMAERLSERVEEWSLLPAIGRPIGNTEIYVLDREMQRLPVGVAGELYIGGEGVARGYFNRPELTAEKFIPDPFRGQEGARLYRSGDLASYQEGGEVQYLGRVDEQVKLRGYRIEPGEVEAVLSEHAAVAAAVVVMREEERGGGSSSKRLVAYVVGKEGTEAELEPAELKEYLRSKLPEYMVPTAYVLMASLPLNANGKVDRRALPAVAGGGGVAAEYVAPRTATEEIVAGSWRELLGVEQVGIHDNFFEMGGHSLLATQVVSRVRRTFGVEIALRALFEQPTVEKLALRIEEARGQGEGQGVPAMVRAERGGKLPLSYAQQRLWFIDQFEPNSALYNLPLGLRLEGELQLEALQQSLSEIVRRHEALRTSFVEVDGEAVQVIGEAERLALPLIDLSELGAEERQVEARRVGNAEAGVPFELSRGPLVRARILRMREQEHELLLTMHHIITDGWSMGIMIRELAVLYEAYSQGGKSPLAEMELQYADYAVWQREWLQGAVLEEQLSYWRKQLGGSLAKLALPSDRARPKVASHRGGHETFRIEGEVAAGLKRLSRQENVTLFMTLLAGFQALLYRYTGEAEVVVGADLANRNRVESEGMIGFFVNMMVMRGDLSGEPKFRELLGRVREMTLGAYEHQDVPFQMLVEELEVERELNRTPLFQVVFVLQNAPSTALELTGLKLSTVAVETGWSEFDLVLSMTEGEGELGAVVVYNRDLFDGVRIRRMIGHWQRLLRSIVGHPEQRLSELELLSEGERRQVLEEWNQTGGGRYEDKSIAELFEEQVERHGEAVAVVYGGEQVSYGELNRRANQLGHYLREMGVGAEVRVGICMERSVAMVVGLLGILKAGGAYVPLDASYPAERLGYMVAEGEIAVIVTQERELARLPAHWGQVVCVDAEWELISGQSEANLVSEVSGENLAYVTYTSGSTGKAKGIEVCHRGVVRLVCGGVKYVELSGGERVLQASPLSFDASTFEIWGALLQGGRSVLYEERVPTARGLGRVIEEEGVSTMWLTSSLFNAVLDEAGGVGELAGLKQLLIGGEALSVRHVERGLAELVETELINGYGPTEGTTFTSSYRIRERELAGMRTVPIGRPIGNTEIYVLDGELEPVPVGVAGEIYIGGAGLARGYQNEPGLTAEKFIPHRYSRVGGERLYRSGDRGSYLGDGNIEYLGRVDEQVKLRGYRIEPGEVEAVLCEHAAVAAAVVVMREEERGGGSSSKRLVAYVVGKEGTEAELEPAELKEYLRSKLPEYMVPTAYVLMASLPLNANGKVDRRALPAPESMSSRLEESYVAPRTEAEEELAGVWLEVLGVERVGIHDNFFELGGDSILSIQVVSRGAKKGLNFTVQQVFQYPTVAELVKAVGAGEPEEIRERVGAFELLRAEDRERMPEGVEDAYPLARLQAGMIFHSQYSPETVVYHDIFSLHIGSRLDEEAMRAAVRGLVERHEMLRTRFELSEYSEPLQLVEREVKLELEVEELSGQSEAEQAERVKEAIAEDQVRGFEWGQAPLLRLRVQRRGAESFQLMISFHHAILDGWSLMSLLSELFQHYWQLLGEAGGEQAEKPALRYAEYVGLEREAMESEESRSYWWEQLEGSSVQELPRRGGEQRGEGRVVKVVSVEVSEELSEGLKGLGRRLDVPLKSVLLAGHLRVLRLLSGERDVMTGVVSNGRPEAVDGERVLGLFLNTLPFRQQLEGGSWEELVRQTYENEREMLAHRRYPLIELQQMQGGMGLFETAFNYIHFHVYQGVLKLTGMPVLEGTSVAETNYPLVVNFTMNLQTAGVELVLVYDEQELSAGQMKEMGGYYQQVLEAMVREPGERYEYQSLLSEAEREQVLREWNQTAAAYPGEQSIAELFEEQVERQEEAVAVVYGAEQVSYGELNRRANQLGHYLREMGVGAEVRVGICMERSVAMVVGLLGILKAGGAYVPLDASYPAERLGYMVADAGVTVVLTQESLVAGLEAQPAKLVSLDGEWERLSGQSELNLASEVSGENLAYVTYTSGSTGKAKGIEVCHRGVVRLVCGGVKYVELSGGERVLQASPLSFDASTFEIWGALLQGGRSVLYEERVPTARGLGRVIEEEGVSTMWLTSSLFNAVLDEAGGVGELAGLKQLLIGGEALSVRHVERGLAELVETELINGYGPTEGTTFTSSYRIRERELAGMRTVPIGRPIGNTEIYVLDGELEPVPVGVAGEIYIGGAGLARGYQNEPGLTAEKFIPHRYSKVGGERLYRSGDRGSYLGDGNIEYLGRVDEQVKLRGYRIEPGEVEAVLCEHAAVAAAVVVMREEERGGGSSSNKRLVAYVVGKEGTEAELEPAELKEYLRSKLPEYMVPTAYVLMASLPLNANGKVDRRALPAVAGGGGVAAEYVAPRTATEEIVAGIYAEVLGLERVGAEDNFFEMGGHSLLATQVISRVRQAFEIEAPLRMLFEQPRVGEFAEQIEQAKGSGESLRLPAIVRAERGGKLPLSYAQQRLWFIDQFEPNSALYNIPLGLRLEGELRLEALQQSLSEIVNRHEAFRTRFPQKEGQPVQEVMETQTMPLQLVDLSALPAEAGAEAAQRIGRAEAEGPFDLAAGPLWRARLLRLNEQEHVLLLTMHHIITDGWSMGIMIRELAVLYEAYSQGGKSPLEEMELQYADYAVWQREWLQGAVLEEQLSYWRKQLGGSLAKLALPSDRARPKVASHRGGHETFRIEREVAAGLKRLSRQQNVTLFMTLLAGFQALLYRYTGATEIRVGTPIANRNQVESEGMIGFFVNTLVLRSELAGEMRFAELMKRVRETAIEGYGHQDVPFEKLVEELEVERELSQTPLFQVMFVLQNAPMEELQLRGLTISSLAIEETPAKFDLTLNVMESDGQLVGVIEYNMDLFEAARMERMSGHLQNLLAGVVAHPEQRLSELPMLSEAEARQLFEWNQTAVAYPGEQSIAELFEEQVERQEEAVAVVYGAEQVSYGELNRRANQLGHYLREMGVGAEVRVGICMERSVAMVVGLLGILKAGGAYVPLDASYPAERLGYMVADAGVTVVLTQESLVAGLEAQPAKLVSLDGEWERLSGQSELNLASEVSGENLAYVTYTSGSTGKAKGIEVCHRGVVRLVCGGVKYVELSGGERVLQASPLSFDASTFEIWGALLQGGRSVLYEERVPTARGLGRVIEEEGVSTMWLTSSLFNAVLDEAGGVGELAGLKQLLIGGEALSVRHVERGLAELVETELINGYGPTEGTTFTSSYRIRERELAGMRTVPIGRPIGNTEIYVLDGELEPVPVGVAGEIYIGGAGLARGYQNEPGLTAEKFIPHRYSRVGGERLYRSGDRGSYLGDGNIEYLGRVDEQVKLRGYRIEPGEVEAVLCEHAAVAAAVVVMREEERGGGSSSNKRLVAYVVGKTNWSFLYLSAPAHTGDEEPAIKQLKEYLRSKLPEYMVPGVIVMLDSLPLNANGKVDRRALPAIEGGSGLAAGYVAPRTATEEIVAGIYAEVLGLERVGAEDDFFELGGHSLLATQMMSRVRRTFEVEIALRALFEQPTVEKLALRIEEARGQGEGQAVPAMERAERGGKLPLSYAQQRLWFIDQFEPNSALYNIPLGLRLEGELRLDALQQSLSEIVRRHEALRTSFVQVNGEAVQVIGEAERLALPLIDLSELGAEERQVEARRVGNAEAGVPFELSRGPLMRARIVRMREQEHVLLLTMHHIITDGWSMGIMIRELAVLYEAYSQGGKSPLAEMELQYADYAVWQREWLQGAVLEEQLSYWRKQLGGSLAKLALPSDRARPKVASHRGGHETFRIEGEVAAGLKRLSRQENVTLFMTLLAGFQALLYRYTGEAEVVVGADLANRNRVESEGMIGFFVNMMVMRGDLSGEPKFRELLGRVREMTLGAYEHQDVPFQMLVEELEVERELNRTPLFQVVFVLQNAPSTALELTGLKLSTVAVETGWSEFDLVLSVTEGEGALDAVMLYNTDLFNQATILRMIRHWQTLLSSIVDNPDLPLSSLPMLTEAEMGGLMLSDFPTAELSQKDFESLFLEINESVVAI